MNVQELPTNRIIPTDCITGMRELPDESIDMVITSPPYWGLRDYGDDTKTVWGGDPSCDHEWVNERSGLLHENRNNLRGTQEEVVGRTRAAYIMKYDDTVSGRCATCGAWRGQLGLEPDFRLYLEHLMEIFTEVKRVLKPTGTCWVNLGDTYFSAKGSCRNPGGNSTSIESSKKEQRAYPLHRGNRSDVPYLKPKNLTLIPFHFAIGMQYRGWILRNTIIWHKRNCMPSSVKDRFTVDFEYLFFFSRNGNYFFEQQLEPCTSKANGSHPIGGKKYPGTVPNRTYSGNEYVRKDGVHPKGRNKRTVWTINPQPFPEAHFAVFPEAFVEIPIKAGCPREVCALCGTPFLTRMTGADSNAFNIRVRDVKQGRIKHRDRVASKEEISRYDEKQYVSDVKIHTILSCDCNAGFERGIVLDPFMGSGTTALAALRLNRRFIGYEIKREYCEMAERRIAEWRDQTRLGKSSVSTMVEFQRHIVQPVKEGG